MGILSICLVSFFILFTFRGGIIFLSLHCLLNDISYFFELDLVAINSCSIVIGVLVDWISCLFMAFVLFISSIVIFYRKDYMGSDRAINRFILLVLLFVLSMVLLIISPNLISILLGWDGLGLVSYCLVIYFQNEKSYNAGILTALSNRIGDVLILLSIAWIMNFGSWNYIFYLDFCGSGYSFIGRLLVFAAITKRAQIPFSAWLPAAIAAPTPVSALVHSSTLVTAGVYLLVRFINLLEGSFILKVLLLLGGLTIFIAGLGANFEYDLKKIIALSTLRQLGLIIRILSMGFISLAFFHLLSHALFKALLFMCAGAVIHREKNFQDIRYMGALVNQMPYTIATLNVANLALCGVPFIAGFYSKDIILEIASFIEVSILSYILFYFSTGLTVCYSLRLIYYTIYSHYHSWVNSAINDGSKIIGLRIAPLLIVAICGGCGLRWLIFPTPYIIILSFSIKIITLFVCVFGGVVGYRGALWFLFIKSKLIKNFIVKRFVGSIWFLPSISVLGTNQVVLLIGKHYLKTIDMGLLESFGGQNLNKYLIFISNIFQYGYNNSLKLFLILFLLWVVLCVFML